MHSSAFIFSMLPAAVLAELRANVTYPRHVLHTGSFTKPSLSVGVKKSLLNAHPGVSTASKSICTQPVVTVTTTVTSATLCGKNQPSHTNFPFTDCRYDRPKLSTCTSPEVPIPYATNIPPTQDLETGSLPTKPAKTATVSAKPTKTVTVTWWDSSTTITGVAPWPAVSTLTDKVVTVTSDGSWYLETQHTTTTVWTETYSASTATVYLNTTSISGIFVNPAFLTHTYHADETKTSTLVDFYTKTRVPAHTTVAAPSETADEYSDDDASPSETRLPEYPSVPVPVSIVEGSRTSHVVSMTKSTAQHPDATGYPQNDTFDKDKPEDDGPGYETPDYYKDEEEEDETYESGRKNYDSYDEGGDENEDEDVSDNDMKTTSAKSNGTKSSATPSSTWSPKARPTKTATEGKHTSFRTSKPTAKPTPPLYQPQSTAKNHTALTLFASITSTWPRKHQSKTKTTSWAEKPTTSSKHPASPTSHTDVELEDVLTFSHSSVTLFYKAAHHGHHSTAPTLGATKTEGGYEAAGTKVASHSGVVSTSTASLRLSDEQNEDDDGARIGV